MTDADKAIFEEYFQLQHPVRLNVKQGNALTQMPTIEQFEHLIPLPFKMATEMKGLEQTMLRPIRQLGDLAEPLADYLKAQSRKIDLLTNYILQNENEDELQFQTTSFGGGGFVFESQQTFEPSDYLICKLFFDEDAAAVFCFGRIIDSATIELPQQDGSEQQHDELENEPNSVTRYTVIFDRIRDEDREVVVRASLHLQSKQLLKKTQQKS